MRTTNLSHLRWLLIHTMCRADIGMSDGVAGQQAADWMIRDGAKAGLCIKECAVAWPLNLTRLSVCVIKVGSVSRVARIAAQST